MNNTNTKLIAADTRNCATQYPHSRIDSGSLLQAMATGSEGEVLSVIDHRIAPRNSPLAPACQTVHSGFARLADTLAGQSLQDHPLMKINRLVDWGIMARALQALHLREFGAGTGELEPYDALSLFKLSLLGHWHQLSDAELAYALPARVDFLLFCDFDLSTALPDCTRICGFRNLLMLSGLDQTLLTQLNLQLAHLGLEVQGTSGAILETAIIASVGTPAPILEAAVEA